MPQDKDPCIDGDCGAKNTVEKAGLPSWQQKTGIQNQPPFIRRTKYASDRPPEREKRTLRTSVHGQTDTSPNRGFRPDAVADRPGRSSMKLPFFLLSVSSPRRGGDLRRVLRYDLVNDLNVFDLLAGKLDILLIIDPRLVKSVAGFGSKKRISEFVRLRRAKKHFWFGFEILCNVYIQHENPDYSPAIK